MLWPTATVGDSRGSARHTTATGVMNPGTSLVDEVGRWPTPNVPNGGRTMSEEDVLAKGSTPDGKRQVNLESRAQVWPTPRACSGERSSGSNRTEFYRLWRAPGTVEEGGGMRIKGAPWPEDGRWNTPQAHDQTGLGDPDRVRRYGTKHGAANLVDDAAKFVAKKARLNPRFVCWLMGFPPGWTEIWIGPAGAPVARSSTLRTLWSLANMPFPPGPGGEWHGIPEDLWPAVDPEVEHLRRGDPADGLVQVVSRVDQLRMLGNAVVPKQAALAFHELAERFLEEEG